jgi:hypothetical protein
MGRARARINLSTAIERDQARVIEWVGSVS